MIIYKEEEFDDDEFALHDVIDDENFLWSLDSETGTVPIPFMIQDDLSPEKRNKIAEAVSEYDQKTCIR